MESEGPNCTKLFLGDGPTRLCLDYVIMTYLETQWIKIKNRSY